MLNLVSTGAQVQGKEGEVEGELHRQQNSRGFILEQQNVGGFYKGNQTEGGKALILSVTGQFILNYQEVRSNKK